jgi:uroporphyrinogen decarboxylase
MNLRERFLATARFEPCPRTPRWELGYWAGSIQRWYQEGLAGTEQDQRAGEDYGAWVSGNGIPTPHNYLAHTDHDVANYFNLDGQSVAVDINYFACPQFEPEVLEETHNYVIRRDGNGIVSRVLKPERGMPHWIDYPVHNRNEWEVFKAERYQPDLAARVPDNWDELLSEYRNRDYPLCLGGAAGFFGTVRNIVGLEQALITFYDDPNWMSDMMDHLAEFYVRLYDQLLSQVRVDYCVVWEDMCYVAGPLISPRSFRSFMLAPYNKLTGLLRDHGVDVIYVDTDGDCWKLLELFELGGVTAMYPFEVQSGMDVREVRRRHPHLLMQGGIDKKVLAVGKEAIDRELEAKVPVAAEGGYIPHIDHATPPDVPFENFCYYRRKLDAMLDEIDADRWNRRSRG